MARRPAKPSPKVDQLLKQAAKFSPTELKALRSGIEVLLQEHSENEQWNAIKKDQYGKPSNQKGFIEEKMINGCGPYRYLRYWDGKVHRSVYLGKEPP